MKITQALVVFALSMSAIASFAVPAHAVVAEVVNQGPKAMTLAFVRSLRNIEDIQMGPERDKEIIKFITELVSIQTVDRNIRGLLASFVLIAGKRLSNAKDVEQIVASIATAVETGETLTATASVGNIRRPASAN